MASLQALTVHNPANDLLGIEDQLAVRPGPKAGQSRRNEHLPDGPGRTADHTRGGDDIERRPKGLTTAFSDNRHAVSIAPLEQ